MLFEMTLFFTSFFVHLVLLVMNCRPPLVCLAAPGVFLPVTFVSSTCWIMCSMCSPECFLLHLYIIRSSKLLFCAQLGTDIPAVWNSHYAPDLNRCFITLGRKGFIINPENCLPVNVLFIIFNIFKNQTELKYDWSGCKRELS